MARDVGATGESVTVRIPPVADGRLNVTLQGDGLRASGALDVSQAIVQHLKDVSVSIETQHLSLSSTPQPKALQVLADLRAVDAAHPFGTIVLDDKGLVATVAGDVGAADGAERMLRESSSGIWADMQIAIGGDTGSDHTDAGAAGLELAEWIESELGVPVSTNRGSLTVPLDSVESFTAASQAIAEHNPERLRVVLVNKEAKPRFRVGSRAVNTALSPEENAYPQWVQWWQEFEKTELVEVVEVSDDGVAVWLTSDASDQGSVDKAERVAARIADEYGLAWYEVNNRRTEL
ncbi:hypothetical protein FM104_12165 [Microbacterium esteraromaticum]|uniref:Uncharacterized protein n=1 Tax=Microbacterium esteraromaticum TaxID=57043 RepID=A0A1R4KEF5_9MICO|nr:hypothetical protein FM104_12165 [Microbacterium esteraromaticum]